MQVTKANKISEYYQALLDRDSNYIGIFYACVKTTSVFCISTCRARKPKKENVIYFPTFKEALSHSFRPCKICKPTQNSNETPEQVVKAIELVKASPKQKISDYILREEQLSPDLIRRWFKKNYGLTFHAYQRMYRITMPSKN